MAEYQQLRSQEASVAPADRAVLGDTAVAEDRHDEDMTCKERVRNLLENPNSGTIAQVLHYFIMVVILVSTLCVIIETVPSVSGNPIFLPAEMCFTALFTAEFALRLYACESVAEFATNTFNMIDFLAVFPGYLSLLGVMLRQGDQQQSFAHLGKASSLRMIRIVRLVRVFRVMRICKVARHSEVLFLTFMVFLKVSQSGLFLVLMLIGFAMIVSSSLIYLFESDLCDQSGLGCAGPGAFSSIPASFWWSISTLTTVGYGDMVPESPMGKVIGALTAVVGLLVVSIAISLVSLNFKQTFLEEKAKLAINNRRSRPRVRDGKEIADKLQNFEERSQELLNYIDSLSEKQEAQVQLRAMLAIIKSHRDSLIHDVSAFKTQILNLSDG